MADTKYIWDHSTHLYSGTENNDPGGVTLGVVFSTSQVLTITHVSFWKVSTDTQISRTVAIYGTDGTLHATGTSSGEPTGTAQWVSVPLDHPFTTSGLGLADLMVAAVEHAVARYPATAHGFDAGVTSADGLVTAVSGSDAAANSSDSIANGRFNYGTGLNYPNGAFNNGDYWVDVGYTTDTTTINYGLTKPAINDPAGADTWGDKLNDNFDIIDTTMKANADAAATKLPLAGGTASGDIALNGNDVTNVLTLNGGPLGGYRNKIINGNFDWWQRATSQSSSGYGSDDRWFNGNVGSTKTHSQQAFTTGQTAVPGEPTYFSRTVVTSVAGAGNYATKVQRIPFVRTLAGKKATLTFWAKADASKNIAVNPYQNFGSGGSPSSLVDVAAVTVALTTSWQRFDVVFNVPSISGKTLGSNDNDYLGIDFWFDAGSSYNSSTNSLGQQSGTFDIARVSLVEGDASKEVDPYERRSPQAEKLLCMQFYQVYTDLLVEGYGAGAGGFVYTEYLFPIEMWFNATVTTSGVSYTNASAINTAFVDYQHVRLRITATAAGSATATLTLALSSEF